MNRTLSFDFNIFFSCSNPLERSYNPLTVDQDMLELNQIISDNELNELQEYITLTLSLGIDIRNNTYNELLNEIKKTKSNKKLIENNIKELLNERLEKHRCDDFISEINKKLIHQHDKKNNDDRIWDDDNFLIDY